MNQEAHFGHTYREWQLGDLFPLLETIFKDESVKVVYDIGACVGGWSEVVLDRFGEKEIYAFEPDPTNCDYIAEHSPSVKLIRKGIYYGKDKSHLYNWGNNNCGGYAVEGIFSETDPNTRKREVVVDLVTLESLNLPKPDLIKLDIEGAERNVIEHSEMIKTTPYILVEWHYTDGVYTEEAHSFFKKHLPNHILLPELVAMGNMFILKYEK